MQLKILIGYNFFLENLVSLNVRSNEHIRKKIELNGLIFFGNLNALEHYS